MPPALPLTLPGIVCALGADGDTVLRNALAGSTAGMKPAAGVLLGDVTPPFGFAPLSPEQFSATPSRVTSLTLAAAAQIAPHIHALLSHGIPATRIGVVLGTSNSTMEEFTANPDRIEMVTPAAFLRDHFALRGPAFCVSTACSSSAKSFASARALIQGDICDAVIVGGVDAYTRVVLGGFHALESISPTLTDPMSASRAGINLGEGAALFVMTRPGLLPEADTPVRLLGVGESSDAHHLTAPEPNGLGAEAAMRAALDDAGLMAADIDAINLHGTGTQLNDAMESAAVARLFGTSTPCSSTKPMTGHTLGAAGAIEAALCALALTHNNGVLLPHVWSGARDPALPTLHLVARGEAAPTSGVRTMLSTSFAFGGSNAAVILGKAK